MLLTIDSLSPLPSSPPRRTCANFRALCCGSHNKEGGSRAGQSAAQLERLAQITRKEIPPSGSSPLLRLEGSHLFRVVPGEAVYGGDLTAGNGIAGGVGLKPLAAVAL